ncbi:unnamed protein product [Ranitomeya imitator]|uniref:Cilia- and flagella-associated protein 61 N-terminal domain-containing protein n=1 Tax=Ranitomeya imitator TaxID=111125 RepID=A0ABN9MD23_9NEOB|nr:unnamed protein product [Ranitomeya imitator]
MAVSKSAPGEPAAQLNGSRHRVEKGDLCMTESHASPSRAINAISASSAGVMGCIRIIPRIRSVQLHSITLFPVNLGKLFNMAPREMLDLGTSPAAWSALSALPCDILPTTPNFHFIAFIPSIMTILTSESGTTAVVTVRRTESQDVHGISKLKMAFTQRVFGNVNVIYLLEKSNLAVTISDEENNVLAHAVFLDYPSWDVSDQAEWEDWLYGNYEETEKCTVSIIIERNGNPKCCVTH